MKLARAAILTAVSAAAACGWGQMSNASAQLTLYFMNRQLGAKSADFHAYDDQGHFSIFSLQASTEQGLHAYVSERLERPSHDPDRDSLEQYYLEDPGVWRIGKQYLPFGGGHILNDLALAVRSDQTIAIWGLPVTVIGADNGRGRTQGVAVSLGGNFGLAAAVGQNFGISSSSLLAVRLPDASPGVGNGYKRIYDAWYRESRRDSGFWLEAASLQMGDSLQTKDDFVVSAGVVFTPFKGKSFTLSAAHDSSQRADFYAVSSSFRVNKSMTLLPFIRFKNGQLFDACLAFSWKL